MEKIKEFKNMVDLTVKMLQNSTAPLTAEYLRVSHILFYRYPELIKLMLEVTEDAQEQENNILIEAFGRIVELMEESIKNNTITVNNNDYVIHKKNARVVRIYYELVFLKHLALYRKAYIFQNKDIIDDINDLKTTVHNHITSNQLNDYELYNKYFDEIVQRNLLSKKVSKNNAKSNASLQGAVQATAAASPAQQNYSVIEPKRSLLSLLPPLIRSKGGASPMRTNEKVKMGKATHTVYIGARGGRYIRQKGEFIRLKK